MNMLSLLHIFFIFITIVALRFLYYYLKYTQIKSYFKLYQKHINNPSHEMDEKKYLVIELFKEAGVSNFSIPTLEPAGYGYLQKQILNGFENLSYINSQQIATVTVKFHEAIGVFRFRMFQTINPIFWLEFVLKLPVFLFKYLGVESSNIFVKLVQVAYWILGIVIFLKELGLL